MIKWTRDKNTQDISCKIGNFKLTCICVTPVEKWGSVRWYKDPIMVPRSKWKWESEVEFGGRKRTGLKWKSPLKAQEDCIRLIRKWILDYKECAEQDFRIFERRGLLV